MDEDLEEEATPPRLTNAPPPRQESPLSSKRNPDGDAEGATPPPPKRKKFFAKDDDESDDVTAIEVKDEVIQDAPKAAKKNKAPVVVDLLDDDSDIENGPVASTSKKAAKPPKPRIPKNGKDFKGERYFGCM